MKKIYSLMLAGLCLAGTAVAVGSVLDANTSRLRDFKGEKKVQTVASVKKAKAADSPFKAVMSKKDFNTSKLAVRGMRKADSNASIEGTWTFDLGDYYFQSSTLSTLQVEYEATLDGTEVLFEESTGYYLPMVAEYNASAGTLTFSREVVGYSSYYQEYIYQEPFVWNSTIKDLDLQDITGTYYADNGSGNSVILFDTDNGISWVGYVDLTPEASDDNEGYYSIYDLEGATKENTASGGDDSESWKDLGNAVLIDPWLIPAFGEDQWDEDYQWEVPLQQNIDNPNIYRLVDPYHIGPVAYVNNSTSKGYIMFDVTDPDHVVFLQSEAGFAYSGMGISKFYCYNALGMYVAQGYSADFVVSVMGDDMPYTTFKNGEITLGYYDGDDGREYDANFGIQGATTGGYIWTDEDGNVVNMTGKIIFPKEEDGDDEGEGVTYEDSVTGSYSQTMNEVTTDYPYTFDYAITYNANKTLSINGQFNWKNGTPVGATDGLTANIPGVGTTEGADIVQGVTFEYKADGKEKTFEEGETVEFNFSMAVALGRVEQKVTYVVGSTNNGAGGETMTLTGNMTYQTDMNMGWGPDVDLTEPETEEVTAVYDSTSKTLKFETFGPGEMPISFVITDFETGAAEAVDQLAYIDDNYGDPESALIYYYADIATKETVVYATVEILETQQTRITLDAWGEYLAAYDFFNSAFYNTVIVLDGVIPGFDGETELPTLTIQDVTYEWNQTDYGATIEFKGKVVATGLPDDAEIKVYYTYPGFSEPYSVDVVDGVFSFIISGFTSYEQNYEEVMFAQSGTTQSETYTVVLTPDDLTGVELVGADAADARYFNLQGVEVKNPAPGQIYIKVANGKAVKTVK